MSVATCTTIEILRPCSIGFHQAPSRSWFQVVVRVSLAPLLITGEYRARETVLAAVPATLVRGASFVMTTSAIPLTVATPAAHWACHWMRRADEGIDEVGKPAVMATFEPVVYVTI